MLSSVEQAFVGREEKRAPLKTPVWEAKGFSIYIFFFIVYSKGERTSGELTREEFSEFKSILLFYVDFCQKQKVMVIG